MAKQVIYYGAPGTGKSYSVKEQLKGVSADRVFRVTIHPEFSYSDFIGQLLPVKKQGSTTIGFEFVPGPFTKALKKAYVDNSKNVYLVLEEISRGNVTAIFGDIFQLLDRGVDGNSKYPIINENITNEITSMTTNKLVLPSNFHILATVNVNDQSVFPMDTAFKRRFEWEYISSRPVLSDTGSVDTSINNPLIRVMDEQSDSGEHQVSWLTFYTSLNNFITDRENGLGKAEDKQIGQFFIEFKERHILDSYDVGSSDYTDAVEAINRVIRNKLLLYLWQDVNGKYSLTSKSLFSKNVKAFDDIHTKFHSERIFSREFLDLFLIPNIGELKLR